MFALWGRNFFGVYVVQVRLVILFAGAAAFKNVPKYQQECTDMN
jgi:hypothetical protein